MVGILEIFIEQVYVLEEWNAAGYKYRACK